MRRQQLLRTSLGCLVAAAFLLACSDYGTLLLSPRAAREPAIALPSQFQWHQDTHPGQHTVAVPTTAKAPGPTVTLHATHRLGFGAPITGPNVLQSAAALGQQVIASELAQLRGAGWRPMFTPTVTGSYPAYVLYVTVRADSHYCFVEYSATALNPQEASQQLDVYDV